MKKIVIDANFQKEYLAEGKKYLEKKIDEKIKKTKRSRRRNVLIILKNRLDLILTGRPSKLREINKQILALYTKNGNKLTKNDIDFFSKIFSYSYFCKSKKKLKYFDAYKLLENLNRRVCPYCDENFILFLNEGLDKDKQVRIRGPFDHYLPKALYPYLALSMHNLVPSCHMCNSLKHDDDTYKNQLINPYEFSICENFHFNVKIKPTSVSYTLSRDAVEIIFQERVGRKDKFAKKNIKQFHNTFRLHKRYTNHAAVICRLWDRVRLAENVLKPFFPGYNKQIFKEFFFDTKSPEYQDSPFQQLEGDFLAKFFP